MKHTIENTAKILLKHGIPFQYKTGCLQTQEEYTLFSTATYHTDTKELVLMKDSCGDYAVVNFEDFVTYVSSKK